MSEPGDGRFEAMVEAMKRQTSHGGPPPMTPDELAAIRERDETSAHEEGWWERAEGMMAASDRRALLAHIDAITEAVEGLRYPWPIEFGTREAAGWNAAFEAIGDLLRGKTETSEKEDSPSPLRGTPQR